MEENSVWKAARVGTVEAAHRDGSASMWARRGSTERAGRESIREATKEAGARAVASGREMPPAVAGRRSWKAVRLGPSERRKEGSRRRMAAMARAARALADLQYFEQSCRTTRLRG
tara:strand:+ start:379 stop:726 length:348 start_codon:yes stop_codon:yes gene_type:complete